MFRIALKMLFGDRTKCIILLSALTFSSLLMTEQSAIFCGLMRWSTALLQNSNAKIWVVDPQVEQINETTPLRDIDLQRVRSVKHVKWAMPLSWTIIQAKAKSGEFLQIQLIGLDSSTLAGAPRNLLEGSLLSLLQPKTVIIDQLALERLSKRKNSSIDLGDVFEINDIEARVVGVCKTQRHFFNYPFVYTTYPNSLQYRPKQRRMLNFIIAEPHEDISPKVVAEQIQKETGLKAFTERDFFWSTIWWVFENTGIPIAIGTTIILVFLVGLCVSGQTFYSFVVENIAHFGILKAMGLSNKKLIHILLIQAFSVGLAGYGMGIGLASLFGWSVLYKGFPPFYLPYELLFIVFASIVSICLFSVLLAARKITSYEPGEVFKQ